MNLFIHKAAAEVFCILAIRVSIPCGAAQCVFTVFFCALLLLLLCLCVSFFLQLLSRAFLVQETFFDQTDGMGDK